MSVTIEKLQEELKQAKQQIKEAESIIVKGVKPIMNDIQFFAFMQENENEELDDIDKAQIEACEDFWNSTESYQEKYNLKIEIKS